MTPREAIRVLETCGSCGGAFEAIHGATHAYMRSSPACYAAFGKILAAEYQSEALQPTHRLTVDTYAVQHAGPPGDRRAIQSTGLHLVRLMLQLDRERPPIETNAVMLAFSRHKTGLPYLTAPRAFEITAANVAPFAGTAEHADRVRRWALTTWNDWSEHHDFVRQWADTYSTDDSRKPLPAWRRTGDTGG